MSLVARLLSKSHSKEPDLQGIDPRIGVALDRERPKKKVGNLKILLLSLTVFLSIILGYGAVYWVRSGLLGKKEQVPQALRASIPMPKEAPAPPLPQKEEVKPQPAPPVEVAKVEEKKESVPIEAPQEPKKEVPSHRRPTKVAPKAKGPPPGPKVEKTQEPPVPNRVEEEKKESVVHQEPLFQLTTEKEAERDMYIYQAKAMEERNDVANALLYYRKALEIDPKSFKVNNKIASLCIRIEDGPCALEYAQRATLLRPDHVPALVNLGIALGLMGRMEEAEDTLLKAHGLSPHNVEALYNLAVLKEYKGEYQKALEYYSHLVKLGHIQYQVDQGRCLEALSRYEEALAIYDAIASNPAQKPSLQRYAIERMKVINIGLSKGPSKSQE